MMQQVDFRMLCSKIVEIMKVFLFASVIDQNNIGKTVLQQTVHNGDQLVIRIKRRQDNRDLG